MPIAVNENIKEEIAQPQESLKLLSAKMPENIFNASVPLKVVRTMRKPKPVPTIIRKRYGRVNVKNELKQQPKEPEEEKKIEAVPFTIKVLAEEDDATTSNFDSSNVQVNNINGKVVSSDEEEMQGFNSDSSFTNGDQDVKLWFEYLSSETQKRRCQQTKITDFANFVQPKKLSCDSKKKVGEMISEQKIELDCPSTSTEKTSVQNSLIELNSKEIVHEFSEQPVVSKTFDDEDIGKQIQAQIALIKDDLQPIVPTLKKQEIMDTNESKWLNNISIMIGEHRLQEIDQGLKKIPSIVTGNKIETENVELKLIINHLLNKLKVQSVSETIDPLSPLFLDSTGS